jgi:hypothetical protein
MTFATEIAKTTGHPRTVVDIYDGVTHRYYGSSASYIGSDFVDARLMSISGISTAKSDLALSVAACTIVLADPDRELYDLDIDPDWTITVYLTYASLGSVAGGQGWIFVVRTPPEFFDGKLTLRCISAIKRNLGKLNLPTITEDDFDNFANTYDPVEIIGKTFPIYYGDWVSEDTIPCTYIGGSASYLYFAVGVYSGSDDPKMRDAFDTKGFGYIGARGDFRLISSTFRGITNYLVLDETITRTGEFPATWELIVVRFSRLVMSYMGLDESSDIRALLKMPIPSDLTSYSYDRQDSEDAVGWTPVDVVRAFCRYYLSTDAGAAVSTDAYDDASFLVARDILEDRGIFSKIVITSSMSGFDLVNQVINQTKSEMFASRDGKLYCDALESGDYSGAAVFEDYKYALNVPKKSNLDNINEVVVSANNVVEILQDEDAQTTVGQAIGDATYTNLNTSSAHQASWIFLQRRRNKVTPIQFTVDFSLAVANLLPGDVINFSERWSGGTNMPLEVLKIVTDLKNHKCSLILGSVVGYISDDVYVLFDEDAIKRTYPSTTATVTSGSGVVALSTNGGDSYSIKVGDVFEVFSALGVAPFVNPNNVSTKVIVVPTWSGTVWEMTVANTVWTNEVIAAADWRVLKSWMTATPGEQVSSGFLCNSATGLFTDSDPGRELGF